MFAKSMTFGGLVFLLAAVVLGFSGCAGTPPPIPSLTLKFPASGVNPGETEETRIPSLIPGVELESRDGECGQEYAGLADSYTDTKIGETGYRWEQITVTKHRIYRDCPKEPADTPASAPSPEGGPTSMLKIMEPRRAQAPQHSPPVRLYRPPEPRHWSARVPSVRRLWLYRQTVFV